MIGFIHVPKCAGTSIISGAREAGPVYQYGVDAPYAAFKEDAPHIQGCALVGGHLTLDELLMVPGVDRIVMVVRDPIKRVLSWMRFLSRREASTLYDWTADGDHAFLEHCDRVERGERFTRAQRINAREATNGICRRLGVETAREALDRIESHSIAVLKQEQLTCEDLRRATGLELDLPRLNTAPSGYGAKPSVIERIREMNTEDIELVGSF